MKLTREMKASIRAQREAGYPTYNFFVSRYPFSFVRLITILAISATLAGTSYALVLAFEGLKSTPPAEIAQIIGSLPGPRLTPGGIRTAMIALILVFPPLSLFATIGMLFQTIRKLQINLFKEAVEIIDAPLPMLPPRKRTILTSEIEDVSIRKNDGMLWVVLALGGGNEVPLLIRTEYNDDESARTIQETIQRHRTRLEKTRKLQSAPGWRRRLAGFVNTDEYDDVDDEEKLQLMRHVLDGVAGNFSNTKIIVNDDENRLELRMKLQDVPVRLVLGRNASPVIEAKARPGEGSLEFSTCADEDLPPARNAGDPWSEEEERLFVAKGVLVEEWDETLALLGALPESLLDAILAGLENEANPVVSLIFDTSGLRAETFNVLHMNDPVQEITEAVRFIGEIAGQLAIAGPVSAETTTRTFEVARCPQCGSRYVEGIKIRCPNCGSMPETTPRAGLSR